MDRAKHMAKVNQHPPVHNEIWMVNGQETGFCRVPNSLANKKKIGFIGVLKKITPSPTLIVYPVN
jgi:hypothetical protein